MDRPTPAQIHLAWQILSKEGELLGDGGTAEAVALAGTKLRDRLARIFSDMAIDALLRRAVHLASVDFPFLSAAEGPDSIADLRAVLDDVGAGEARDAAGLVFGYVIGLLVQFIGDDLTLRAIGEVWPDTTLDGTRGAAYEEQR